MGHNKRCNHNRDYLDDAQRQGEVKLQYPYSSVGEYILIVSGSPSEYITM
jgi:hypothetical protein